MTTAEFCNSAAGLHTHAAFCIPTTKLSVCKLGCHTRVAKNVALDNEDFDVSGSLTGSRTPAALKKYMASVQRRMYASMTGLVRCSRLEDGKEKKTNDTKTSRPKDATQMSTKLHVTRATRHSCGVGDGSPRVRGKRIDGMFGRQ